MDIWTLLQASKLGSLSGYKEFWKIFLFTNEGTLY